MKLSSPWRLMCSALWGCNNYNSCSQNNSLAAKIIASKPHVLAISGYSSGTQWYILIKQVNDLEPKEPYRNVVPFINTSDLTSRCIPIAQLLYAAFHYLKYLMQAQFDQASLSACATRSSLSPSLIDLQACSSHTNN